MVTRKLLAEVDCLEHLDVSLNEITSAGIYSLAQMLPHCSLKVLNLSKNLLGDESLIIIADNFDSESDSCLNLCKLDLSSCRITDNGLLQFMEKQEYFEKLTCLRFSDNFISEKVDKVILELLDLNKQLVSLGGAAYYS